MNRTQPVPRGGSMALWRRLVGQVSDGTGPHDTVDDRPNAGSRGIAGAQSCRDYHGGFIRMLTDFGSVQARKALDFGMERVTLIVRLAPSIERCVWNASALADTEDDPYGHFEKRFAEASRREVDSRPGRAGRHWTVPRFAESCAAQR